MYMLPERTCIYLSFIGFCLGWFFSLTSGVSFDMIVVRAVVTATVLGALGYALTKVIIISIGEHLSLLSNFTESLPKDNLKEEKDPNLKTN